MPDRTRRRSGERIVKAFADIVDAPGGLLLVNDAASLAIAASWNWPAPTCPPQSELRECCRLLERGRKRRPDPRVRSAARRLGAAPRTRRIPFLRLACSNDAQAWAGIPLIHHERLVGIVLLAAPEYRRPLDWEDFDLLRTAGRQAASSLAEAHGQEALSNAQRFEEFNRRFAFILHDVKNLVSQLSLLARNAERHADNPEFRADMVATLKVSVGKMNDLLARLVAAIAGARVQRIGAAAAAPDPDGGDRRQARRPRGAAARRCEPVGAASTGPRSSRRSAICSRTRSTPARATMPVTVRVASQRRIPSRSRIADKGVGMDADFIRNRLFQPFASTKPGGFGIGAFEARSLIAAMGGRLSVDSRPGKGTTFTILLPAAEPVARTERKRA